MTVAQVQPLNTPTASELTKAHDFLYEADLLVTDVKSLFRNSGDFPDGRPAQGNRGSPCG